MSFSEKEPLLPTGTETKSSKRKYLKWFLLITMLCLSTAFINSFYYQQIRELIFIPSLELNMLCSGHGIVMTGDNCVCDLGYEGRSCELKSIQAPKEVIPSSVAIFTDSFGPLDSKDVLSLYYESMANNLKKNGHSITVIYTGKGRSQFDKVSNIYSSKGIRLVMLDAENTFMTLEQKSFAAYSYLRSLAKDFSTVIFSSSSHTAFYTMNSVHQGLVTGNTKFVLSLDDLSENDVEMKLYPPESYVVTDLSVLKKHFMTKESIKRAKNIISPDQELISFYKVKDIAQVLPHVPILETSSNIAFKHLTSIKELVFIAGRNDLNGIVSFCDAIDRVVLRGSTGLPFSGVTFFLSDRDINGMPAKDYIEFRSEKWEKMELQSNILLNQDYQTIVQYFDDKNKNRVAVVPSAFGGSSIIKAELAGSGVPMLSVEVTDDLNIKDVIVKSILGNELQATVSKGDELFMWKRIWDKVDTTEGTHMASISTDLPLVSVILVHHNRPELLKQAISSLEKQTYTNFEVVLVDDGSTDPAAIAYIDELSWKWWEEKGWKVIREPNRYLGASRNTGVKHANGKFVLFMDDDDYAKPHQIETFVKVAMATKSPVMTSGHDIFNGRSPPTGQSSLRYTPIGADVLSGMLENVFGDSAMFVEKEYFVESGGFTEEFGVGFEDYEYLAKVALRGDKMEAIAEPLHWYRIHQGTMSESTQLKTNQLRVFRAYSLYDFTADWNQKNLLLHIRDNFLKDRNLDKRQNDYFSSIFISNGTTADSTTKAWSDTSTDTLTDTLTATPTATVTATPLSTKLEIDLIDPAYIFDSPAKNFKGLPISRTLALVGKNFGISPVVKILKSEGEEISIKYLSAKTDHLNGSQSVILIDQSEIDAVNGPVKYVTGIISGVMFKVNDSSISRVYYSSLSNFKPQQIQYSYNLSYFRAGIWMKNLIDSPTPYCIMNNGNDTDMRVSIPAVYDRHSGQVLCAAQLPAVSKSFSSVHPVHLVLSPTNPGPSLSHFNSWRGNSTSWEDYVAMISMTAEPFQFSYPDVPPVMLNASFHDSGAFITVTFDKSIFIRGENSTSKLYCADVFVNNITNSTILSVVKEDCVVSISNPSTIQLTFDGKFLSEYPPLTGRGSSGFVLVQPPNNPPVPVVNLQSAPVIGGCSDFVLSFSGLSGSAGRAFTSMSILVTPPRSASAFRSAVALEQLLNAKVPDILQGKLTQIVISADELASVAEGTGMESGSYNITVSVKNFWGQVGIRTYPFVFTQDKALPNVFISGPGSTDVDPRKDNSISAQIKLSTAAACKFEKKASFKFSWNLIGSLSVPVRSDSSVLLIKPLRLYPGSSYNATLTLSVFINNQVTRYVYYYLFTTGLDVFESSLGGRKEIGNAQNFSLVPQISNEYYREKNFSNYGLTWDCYEDPGTKCRGKDGVTLDLSLFARQKVNGFDYLQIPAETFYSGSFIFEVTATNRMTGVKGVSKSTTVDIVTGVVPDVTLVSNINRPSSEDSQFKITANVAKGSVSKLSNVKFLWTSETECEGESYVEASMLDSDLVAGRRSSVLKFKPGVLVPGASYCFSLLVLDSVANTNATSFMLVDVRNRPSNGVCVAENAVGDTVAMRSLLDKLTFSCSSWITDEDSYPISYAFEIQKEGSQRWKSVSRNSPTSSISLDLLEGSYRVRAIISDSAGTQASSPVFVNIVVSGFTLSKRSDYYDFIGEWFANKSSIFEITQNLDDFSSALATLATLSFEFISSESHKNLQALSLLSINSMINSDLVLFNQDAVGYLADQIKTFSGTNCSIPSENLGSSLDLTFNLLEKANQTTSELEQSLSSDVLDQMLASFDNLICASGQSPPISLLSKKNEIFQKISSIALRRAACGEVSYETEMGGFSLTVGKDLSSEFVSSSDRTIGIFNLTLSNNTLSDCPSYVTGKKASTGVIDDLQVDGNVYQMSYVDYSGKSQEFSSGIDIQFIAKLTDKSPLNSKNPLCSYLRFSDDLEDISTAVVSQEGCVVVSIDEINGNVRCKCTHLSDFLVVFSAPDSPPTVLPAPPGPTGTVSASPTETTAGSADSTTTIIAAAVGGSIGAILVIGAVLYVGLKVLPKRKYSPGQENNSKNDQVMIGVAGPSNQNEKFSSNEKVYAPDVKNADFS